MPAVLIFEGTGERSVALCLMRPALTSLCGRGRGSGDVAPSGGCSLPVDAHAQIRTTAYAFVLSRKRFKRTSTFNHFSVEKQRDVRANDKPTFGWQIFSKFRVLF